jgi:type III secretory pathway lipoprotein EscJ
VDAADASAARRLLVAHGIPRDPAPGYAEATAKTGMIPSASDEKLKVLHALQGEIDNALMAIEGVLEAKTLINRPDAEPLSLGDEKPKTTASVVISWRRNKKQTGEGFEEPRIDEPKVRRIVANAVEGLDEAMVEVYIDKVDTDLGEPRETAAGGESGGGGGREGLFKMLSFAALGVIVLLAILLMLAGKQKKDLRRRVLALQRQMADGGERAPQKAAAQG